MSRVTVRCPFCEKLFLMPHPLFLGERERTACPSCRAEAESNMVKMSARCRMNEIGLANPLQELAEKLEGYTKEVMLPILTESLGTLLQAERAATIKECRAIAETNASTPGEAIYCQGDVQTFCAGMSEAMQRIYKAIGKLDPDASALSAVVQHEIEELKALLTEALATIREYIQSDATRWIKANENTTITSKIAKVLEEDTKKEKNACHSKTDGEGTSGIKA